MSVNQTGLNVLDADVSDLGVGGRGALVLASAVFELVLTAQSPVCSGFRVMYFRRGSFDRCVRLAHRVLQLPNCHALSF